MFVVQNKLKLICLFLSPCHFIYTEMSRDQTHMKSVIISDIFLKWFEKCKRETGHCMFSLSVSTHILYLSLSLPRIQETFCSLSFNYTFISTAVPSVVDFQHQSSFMSMESLWSSTESERVRLYTWVSTLLPLSDWISCCKYLLLRAFLMGSHSEGIFYNR